MSRKQFEKLDEEVFSIVDARNARLQKSYQDILPQLRALFLQMEEKWGVDGNLSFPDLNKYNRWNQLLDKMESISSKTFRNITKDIDEDLQEIYVRSYNTAGGIIQEATGGAIRGSLQTDVLTKALKTPVGGLTIDLRMDRIRDDLATKMTGVITRGVQNGDSWTKIAGELKNEAGKNLSTVQRIVRTEGHRLEEQGKFDVANKSTQQLLKVWTTERDSRVRPWHVVMDGQTRELDEEFESPTGARGLMCGNLNSPEDDINDRCFVTYIPKEEK
jgi:hypothetical protein